MRLGFYVLLAILLGGITAPQASALQYRTCLSPDDGAACQIAYAKIRTLENLITKTKYFHDGIHINSKGAWLLYPLLYVATPDLDGDGRAELIALLPEATEELDGQFCPLRGQCPNFIFQDRTLRGQKRTLKNFKAFDIIYAYALGLSTDEVVGNYRSLRAYFDKTYRAFDVYQYDARDDQYYNISAPPS